MGPAGQGLPCACSTMDHLLHRAHDHCFDHIHERKLRFFSSCVHCSSFYTVCLRLPIPSVRSIPNCFREIARIQCRNLRTDVLTTAHRWSDCCGSGESKPPLYDLKPSKLIRSQYVCVYNPKYEREVKRHAPKPVPPEARLAVTLFGGPLFAVAFFWFG